MPHTYAIMTVSLATYEEIRAKLIEAGHHQQIDGEMSSVHECLDMHGIALQVEEEAA